VRRNARRCKPFFVLSGRPFHIYEGQTIREFRGCVSLGLNLRGDDDAKEFELSIDVLWNADRWTLQTDACVESEAGGQDQLRALPERTATDVRTLKTALSQAVIDLLTFDDLVPPGSGAT
jgi:hypothetical protein